MRTVLGLDAGGTFTDAVVIDAVTKRVLYKAKTRTTPHNLTGCLETAFARLPTHLLTDISMVCLSTTLATNAVVEGRGCREALVLIGGAPRGVLPTSRQVLLRGRFDLKGRLVENLDPGEVRRAVDSLNGTVDAIAVSGYASVRNPEHERYVKAVIEDRLGVPVVCAHELSTRLGHLERTVTAVLNARLIPMVWDLTDSVQRVMHRYAVTAPLMLVRGDGTLMPEGVARTKPIETILSGPAASALGAFHLSGRPDCLVVDIGGTTTDVARVEGGQLVTRPDGAQVGDWRMQVRAAEVFTVGLGGDSRIVVDGDARAHVGPSRSESYAHAAQDHPHLVTELAQIVDEAAHRGFLRPDHEAYAVAGPDGGSAGSSGGCEVLSALADGPHTAFHLARTTNLPELPTVLEALVAEGRLQRISLTPTDLWQVTGEYRSGSARAAELALQITAEAVDRSPAELVDLLQRTLRSHLDLTVLRAALHADRRDTTMAESLLGRSLPDGGPPLVRASYEIARPVVAIGGPAGTWLNMVGDPLAFPAEVPDHAEVANAIGAAVAHAVETIDVLIRKDTVLGRYLVFSPEGRQAHATLAEATQAAVQSGTAFLRRVLGEPVEVRSGTSDVEVGGVASPEDTFVERVVTLTARSHPTLGNR